MTKLSDNKTENYEYIEQFKKAENIFIKVRDSVYKMLEREKSMHNLTNVQLAKKLEVSLTTIRTIFNGNYNGKIFELINIAVKLGYTPEIKFEHPIFTEN